MMRQLRRMQNSQNIGRINNGSGGVGIKPWMQRRAKMMQRCNKMHMLRQIQRMHVLKEDSATKSNNFGQQNKMMGRKNLGCKPGRQALIGGMRRHRDWSNAAMKNGGRAYLHPVASHGQIQGF